MACAILEIGNPVDYRVQPVSKAALPDAGRYAKTSVRLDLKKNTPPEGSNL